MSASTQEKPLLYDVVVVGAGIQGVGTAQAAVLNGLNVLVLERQPVAGAETSSKSSKLIHGGLRYLETLSFSLVRECLRERRHLLQNAPSLVKVNRFYIPVYKQSKRPGWLVYLGLRIYAALDGDWRGKSIGSITKIHWSQLDGLNTRDLHHVFFYEDAQTHDQKLTQAIAASAAELGADFRYDCALREMRYRGGEFVVSAIEKVVIANDREDSFDDDGLAVDHPHDYIHHVEHTIRAKVVVNAAGPWVNSVAGKLSPLPEILPADLVQGVHIVIDHRLSDSCFYAESPDDGRAVFILPWQGRTLIGTTETQLNCGAGSCAGSEQEISYLLNVSKHYFPNQPVTRANVLHVFAGVRTLPKASSSTSSRSRETRIVQSQRYPGYFAVYGGKLTAYRATAETVVGQVYRYLGKDLGLYKTTESLSLEPWIDCDLTQIDRSASDS